MLSSGRWWGSVLLINASIVAIGLVEIVLLAPESRDPHPQALDPSGFLRAVAGLVPLMHGPDPLRRDR